MTTIAALLVAPIGPGASGATTAAAAESAAPASERAARVGPRQRVVQLTNAHRRTHGCPPLRRVGSLDLAAQRHTQRMAAANQLSHQLPGEPPLGRRVTLAGYRGWTLVGENVAYGYRTPRAVVSAWMRSPGHRRNILDCRFRHIGVGLARGHGALWWTQDFGRR